MRERVAGTHVRANKANAIIVEALAIVAGKIGMTSREDATGKWEGQASTFVSAHLS